MCVEGLLFTFSHSAPAALSGPINPLLSKRMASLLCRPNKLPILGSKVFMGLCIRFGPQDELCKQILELSQCEEILESWFCSSGQSFFSKRTKSNLASP